jgi:hypothetical protein
MDIVASVNAMVGILVFGVTGVIWYILKDAHADD